jgi:glutaredoxin 3
MGGSESKAGGVSKDSIIALTKETPIVMFTSATCPYCHQAKAILTDAGHKFKEIVANPDQRATLRSMTTQSSVPSIWVKGTFVGGCNDGPESWMGLTKVLKSGKFAELLNK